MKKHYHDESKEIDETTKSIKPYWLKQQKYAFTTSIQEIEQKWVRLKNHNFYPESGGQLGDQGVLTINEKVFDVIDTQIRDKTIWLNVPNLDSNIQINQEVYARIDKQRRYNLSRNHSSQHLISAVFWEIYENETIRAEIGLNETQISLKNTPTKEEIIQSLIKTEEIIVENLPITSQYVPSIDHLNTDVIRGKISHGMEIYRLVNIGSYDSNLCGGTHVEQTSDIGTIHLHKQEGRKIRFYSGIEAKRSNIKYVTKLQNIAKLTGSNVEQIETSINNIISERDRLTRENIQYRKEISKFTFDSQPWIKINNLYYKLFCSMELDKGLILDIIGKVPHNHIVFAVTPSNLMLIVSDTEKLTAEVLNRLRSKGLKGGGRGKVVMGKLNQSIDQFITIIEEVLSV